MEGEGEGKGMEMEWDASGGDAWMDSGELGEERKENHKQNSRRETPCNNGFLLYFSCLLCVVCRLSSILTSSVL